LAGFAQEFPSFQKEGAAQLPSASSRRRSTRRTNDVGQLWETSVQQVRFLD
jgi:hypothetical protein